MPNGTSAHDQCPWDARHPAVWFSRVLDPEALQLDPEALQTADCPAGQAVALIRHAEYPMPRTIAVAAADRPGEDPHQWLPGEGELVDLARQYVDRLADRWPQLREVQGALGSAGKDRVPGPGDLGWLGIGWGGGAQGDASADPRRSFWVLRRVGGAEDGAILDRTAVLLAARTTGGRSGEALGLGGDVGLRVVIHVALLDAGKAELRITGCTLSRLTAAGALLPLPKDLITAIAHDPASKAAQTLASLQHDLQFQAPPVIQGIRTGRLQPEGTLRITGEGARSDPRQHVVSAAKGKKRTRSARDDQPPRHFAFVADVSVADGRVVNTLFMQERLGNATTNQIGQSLTRWMTKEQLKREKHMPADARPSYREGVNLDVGQPDLPAGAPAMLGKPAKDYFNLDRKAELDATKGANELLVRMRQLGLVPEVYFKLARLPLALKLRAPMRGAPNGQDINAEVRPLGAGLSACKPWRASTRAATVDDQRPRLAVRFGVADLNQRFQRLDDKHQLRDVQHLSLAADQHWMWHEFGHVLNYASFGEMEFRFAHSAGDALGAIELDRAWQRLNPKAPPNDPRRFNSYPDVPLPRRHDRQAEAGWCWCGHRSMARLTGLSLKPNRRLGYFEEQLVSSALFRLYRSLGGDTPGLQQSASAHVTCLVMKAIALLGPDSIVPAYSADHFVSALIDADLGLPADGVLGPSAGRACKVIRWAFETQGLYATEDPGAVAEGPGKPPPVDLYIGDRRRESASDGGYHPVPLTWSNTGKEPWLADGRAVCRAADHLTITVGNRGQSAATGTTVAAWAWAPQGAWVPLDGTSTSTVPAADGQRHGESIVRMPLPRDLPPQSWVLVAASCDADPHFTLPTPMPDPSDPAALRRLLAYDNNIALALV